MIKTILNITALISGGVASVLILLQSGKTTGLNGALGSSKSLNLFSVSKSRGSDVVYDRLTIVSVTIFAISITVINRL